MTNVNDNLTSEDSRLDKMRPSSVRELVNLGSSLQDEGHVEEAITFYRQAIDLDSRDGDAHYNLAIALQELEREDEAAAEYRKALELNPDDADAHYNLGNILRQNCSWDEAIQEYKEAIKINPDDFSAYNNLALSLDHSGQKVKAEEAYRQLIELCPTHFNAYYNLARLLERGFGSRDVIALYEKAITLEATPNDLGDAHHFLALAYQEDDRIEEALTHYQMALELKPDYYEAHINFGTALHEVGLLEPAIQEYQEGVRFLSDLTSSIFRADLATTYENIARVLLDEGKFDELEKYRGLAAGIRQMLYEQKVEQLTA